jgi:hypothetical protein
MAKNKVVRSALAQARSWATKNRLFGAQAFLRYVMFNFVEDLNQVSDDFVFKGGNLLWVYIHTPRATVDLDLATFKTSSHAKVRRMLEKACALNSDKNQIIFAVHSFTEIDQEGKQAAAVSISYKTEQGANNRFDIDIVYALPCESHSIDSPIHEELKIITATIENIIADKISACHRFGAGNTRMKDYDDLWRLSRSDASISALRLSKIISERSLDLRLNASWINPEMERIWERYRKRYKDLPVSVELVMEDVNAWLAGYQVKRSV